MDVMNMPIPEIYLLNEYRKDLSEELQQQHERELARQKSISQFRR